MNTPFRIIAGTLSDGSRPFLEWLMELKDKAGVRRIRIYLDRLRSGNFPNTRFVGDGLWELKIHFGPEYRVYYVRNGKDLIVLLCGGDKSTQERDILWAKKLKVQYTIKKENS